MTRDRRPILTLLTPARIRPEPGTPCPTRCKSSRPARRTQRGLTLVSLLILGVMVALIALVTMRVVPTVIEFFAIKKALVRAVAASPTGSAQEIRNAFDRAQAIDDFQSVASKDLKIEKDKNNRTLVSFEYEKRIPLFGPASLVIDYKGDSKSN